MRKEKGVITASVLPSWYGKTVYVWDYCENERDSDYMIPVTVMKPMATGIRT